MDLIAGRDIVASVPKGRDENVRMTIRYDGPLRAPIAAGDPVATLVIEAPDMEPARVPLLAKDSIENAGFFSRITNAFAGWFS